MSERAAYYHRDEAFVVDISCLFPIRSEDLTTYIFSAKTIRRSSVILALFSGDEECAGHKKPLKLSFFSPNQKTYYRMNLPTQVPRRSKRISAISTCCSVSPMKMSLIAA